MSRVDALLREREGYVRRNLPARVAQVDVELARFGVAVETAAVAPAENAAARKPKPKAAPVATTTTD